MERQKTNKVRLRKISFYYKIASSILNEVEKIEKNMPSTYQCYNTSLGWIDESGKILLIDSIENPYPSNRAHKRIPKYDHGEFLLQKHFNKDQDSYVSGMRHIDSKWIKISNMNQISCETFPTYDQLKSFAIVHYICSKKCRISPMNSENDIKIYSKSEDKMYNINIGDLIERYGGEELEDLYYEL